MPTAVYLTVDPVYRYVHCKRFKMTIAFGYSLVLFKTSGFPRLSFIRLSVCSGVPEVSVLVGHENMGAPAG